MARIIYTGPMAQKMAGAKTTTPRVAKTTAPASAQKEVQEQEQEQKQEQVATQSGTSHQQLILQQPQAIKQQQSLALVQIMLHASFGTLFYLREFLPLSCFGERDLHTLSRRNHIPSYDDFLSGHFAQPIDIGRRGQPLKLIMRNRDEKADRILNLLELGVFEALEKNVLEAVQLTVFVDKENPSHVLESYTFSFAYTGGVKDLKNRLSSVSLETTGCTAEMKSFRTAKLGLEMIIRRLITLSTFLPDLPNKRYMEIHLFYTKDCPPEYEPPGFKTTSHKDLLYPGGDEWTRETQSCGAMHAASHSVGLKVTSVKWSGDEQDGQVDIEHVPDKSEYRETVERENDIGIENPETVHATIESIHGNGFTGSQDSSQDSTQTRRDAIEKRILQKMIPLEPSTPDSDIIPTQAKPGLDSSLKTTDFISKPHLSQIRTSEIQERINQSQPGKVFETQSEESKKETSKVSCQCGWDKSEPDMIQCNFCSTWQHLTCYGFLHSDAQNIPDVHACYKCLLEPNEVDLLREMDTLVLLRKALKIIIEDGYPNRVKDFTQKMHCNGHTIVQVTDLLKKQGFLQATPGSKSRGFMEKGLPRFKVPDSQETRQKLHQEIFNPLTKIAHHYMIPVTSGKSLKEGDSSNHEVEGRDDARRSRAMNQNKSAPNSFKAVGKEIQETPEVTPTQETMSYYDRTGKNRHSKPYPAASLEVRKGYNLLSKLDEGKNRYQKMAGSSTSPPSSPRSQLDQESVEHEHQQKLRSYQRQPSLLCDDSQDKANRLVPEGQNRPSKKRKLSNAAHPIDICDPMDSESC